MAITGGDGSIVLTTKVDQSGLKKGFASIKGFAKTASKAFLAIGAAAAATSVAITKMAVSAYADYEQLVGGIETLFKDSAGKVLKYANEAFQTAGVSANEYMRQVTSFSASLIRSTAGDTEKAADIANMALIDISDNVNKMGSSMESVTLAYQGFAKQQYMLLDNLKLGYGGTRGEMERLLKDAEALTGVKYNISNLADVYSAIHAIQEQLGITGTTAKEASTTISGSANMVKASWQNVLSAIAGGGDLEKSIKNLVNSISVYFENIVPVIERSLQGIGVLISKVAPLLVQTVVKSLIQSIPSLLKAVYEMIIGLGKGIIEGIKALFTGATVKVVEEQKTAISGAVSSQNELTEAIEETEKAAKGALAPFDEIKTLTKSSSSNMQVPDVGGVDVGGIVDSKDVEVVEEANESFGFFNKVIEKLKGILKPLQNISLENLVNSLKNLGKSLEPYKDMIWDGLSWLWFDVLAPMADWTIENLIPAFLDTISAALEFLNPILEAIKPTLSWFWDEIIVPMASFAGDLFIDFLNLLTDAFTKLSDWAKENPTAIQIIFDILIGGLAGLWVYNSTKKILDFMENLRYQFTLFTMMDNKFEALGKAINSPALAIGALVAAGLFWVQNWDKIKRSFEGMNAWQKTITIVLGLAAAIAVLWVALSVGVAAAGIVAGLAALGLGAGIIAIGNANQKAKSSKELKSIPSNSVVSSSVPKKSIGGYSIPAYAKGTVVPPNTKHLAWFGDNMKEPEVVSPISTMKQAFLEALQVAGGNMAQDNRPIVLQVDGREIARATRQGNASLGTQTVFGGFANAY